MARVDRAFSSYFEPARRVMPALVAGIHVFFEAASKTWMAGSSPAMTTLIQRNWKMI
jgi:hypothetical protein